MNKRISNTIEDLISDFLYYDRKEDIDLPVGAIELAIKDGEISLQEIVDLFTEELIAALTP